MTIFLFRNRANPIEFCATRSKSGDKLPKADWRFHAEVQNALQAASYGLMNFEAVTDSISKKGYSLYTEHRSSLLRAASPASSEG
jgi:hypothetical protein